MGNRAAFGEITALFKNDFGFARYFVFYTLKGCDIF